MIAAIHGDEKLLVNAEDGKRALEVVLAIYQSAASGQPVKLPLTTGSTLDFADRFK